MAKSLIRLDIESKEYERKLKQSRRQFEEFTASIGINMKKMTAYGIAVGVASAAINKLTDGIKQCISESIEMAKAGEGIRRAFDRLNRPDLLDNLRKATHDTVSDLDLMKQAVKFKDFRLDLDQLGAMLAFAQKKAADTGQSVDYMVDSIVTGLGRQSVMILDNLGISASEIKEEMKETGDMTQAVGNIIKRQMKEAGDYIETAADRAAQADTRLKNAMDDFGRTLQPLSEAASTFWNDLTVGALNLLNRGLKPIIEAYTEIGRLNGAYDRQGGDSKVDRMISRLGTGKGPGAYSIYQRQLEKFDEYINRKRFQIAAFGGDNSSVAQSAKAKLQNELDGALKMREEYVRRAIELHNKVPAPASPAPSGGGSTSKGGGGTSQSVQTEFQQNQARINALTQEYVSLSDQSTAAAQQRLLVIRSEIAALNDRNTTLKLYESQAQGKYLGGNIQTTGLGSVGDKDFLNVGKGLSPEALEKLQELARLGKVTQDSWQKAGTAISSISGALSSLEDPAAKILGTIGQAIATIALSYAETLAKDKASKTNVWLFIATAAAAMASMVSTISSIHSATGYAQGGVVQGNTYSNDQIPAFLNAGEIVLNQAQQSNVASALQEGGGRGLQVVGHLSGEDIILVANRTFRRKGQGEIVTW